MQVAMAMSVLLHTVVVKMQQCHTRLDRCAHDCRQNSFWYVSALVPPHPLSRTGFYLGSSHGHLSPSTPPYAAPILEQLSVSGKDG